MLGFGPAELNVIAIMVIFSIVIIILFYWKIYSKAGFTEWLSITMIIPLLNVVMLFYFAVADWSDLKNHRNKPKNERAKNFSPLQQITSKGHKEI